MAVVHIYLVFKYNVEHHFDNSTHYSLLYHVYAWNLILAKIIQCDWQIFFLFYQVLESQIHTVHLYSTVSAVVEDLNPVETSLIKIEMYEGWGIKGTNIWSFPKL